MAGSKALQFVFLISFVIISTHALNVILTDFKGARRDKFNGGFIYKTGINVHVDEGGIRHYNGCVKNNGTTYTAGPATKKVIVYIKTYDLMKRTALRQKCETKRVKIAEALSEHNYELLYLGVNNFICWDERLIAEFFLWTIRPNPAYHLPDFQINTIGENSLDLIYPLPMFDLLKYEEEPDVLGGDLLGELRSMNAGFNPQR